jgi:hypothetical protein
MGNKRKDKVKVLDKAGEIYTNVCAKPNCKNKNVVMKPCVAKGFYVGVCIICRLKQIERVSK